MEDLEHDTELLQKWARQNPLIVRVWIFGSRVKGSHGSNSDLDVAVEHLVADGDGDLLTTGLFAPREWGAELQPYARLTLDIWSYQPGETTRIEDALATSSRLIFDRSTEKK